MSLVEYVHQQRWFGAKSQEVVGAEVVDEARLRNDPLLRDALVELRYGDGNHDLYQLLLGEELDEIAEPRTGEELLRLVRASATLPTRDGQISFQRRGRLPDTSGGESRLLGVEQSNSSLVIDDALFLKVYRRIEAGENPDLEIARFLDDHGFPNAPALYGSWSYSGPMLDATLGIVQEFIPSAVDGWSLALEELTDMPDEF